MSERHEAPERPGAGPQAARPRLREAEIRAAMARVDRIARLADARFRVPGTRIRFGLDALIGLIPGIGDVAGLVMAAMVLVETRRIGAPAHVRRRMLMNVGIDFLAGLVPVVGDLLDVAFKANLRNSELLREWLAGELRSVEAAQEEDCFAGALGLLGFTTAAVALIGWLNGSF